jgi:GntR family transcriptional regulator, transcriptional repressor for pyruvate dehydrogenase complex
MATRGQTIETAAPVGKVVRVPKTAELIAADLRRQVVTGTICAGDYLPGESTLMVQYGVSRPTLREAFRILETENLIEIRRGARNGPRVTVPDVSVSGRQVGLLLHMRGGTITDVYEAKVLIEPVCAGLLALRRTSDDIVELTRLAEEMALLAERPEPAPLGHWAQLNQSFNQFVYSRCGNATLALQCELLSCILGAHTQSLPEKALTRSDVPALRKLARSCTKLVRLIDAQDSESAQTHWRSHAQTSVDHILRLAPPNRAIMDLFA